MTQVTAFLTARLRARKEDASKGGWNQSSQLVGNRKFEILYLTLENCFYSLYIYYLECTGTGPPNTWRCRGKDHRKSWCSPQRCNFFGSYNCKLKKRRVVISNWKSHRYTWWSKSFRDEEEITHTTLLTHIQNNWTQKPWKFDLQETLKK